MGRMTTERGWGTGPMILVVGAAAVLVLLGMREIQALIGPVFLALTLVLTARPLSGRLQRKGLPRWAATVVTLVVLYAILVAMLVVIAMAAMQLANRLPQYSQAFQTMLNDGLRHLDQWGVKAPDLRETIAGLDLGAVIGLAQSVAAGLASGTTLILFILLAVAFLTMDTADLSHRTAALRRARPHLTAALAEFGWRVRTYWLYSAIFGAILAVGDFIALAVIGVPLALSWALLAFICNFVPNVGFALALIPPTLMALLDQGPGAAIAVVVSYMAISFVVQTLMLPRFMGDAVGLNTTTTFMSLVFWTLIVGPLGALLAIPMTLFFKAVLIDSTPNLAWVSVFLSGEKEADRLPLGDPAGTPRAEDMSQPDPTGSG